MAWAQSSAGQPACLGCSSWQQCFPRSLCPSPALGTALSSLRRAPQVRARMQHYWPGREGAPEQLLPHHTLLSQVRPGPSLQWPMLGRSMWSSHPRSRSQRQRARYRAWASCMEGHPGRLPGLATVQLGALTGQPGPSVCQSVCVCIGVVYCAGCACEVVYPRNVTQV